MTNSDECLKFETSVSKQQRTSWLNAAIDNSFIFLSQTWIFAYNALQYLPQDQDLSEYSLTITLAKKKKKKAVTLTKQTKNLRNKAGNVLRIPDPLRPAVADFGTTTKQYA